LGQNGPDLGDALERLEGAGLGGLEDEPRSRAAEACDVGQGAPDVGLVEDLGELSDRDLKLSRDLDERHGAVEEAVDDGVLALGEGRLGGVVVHARILGRERGVANGIVRICVKLRTGEVMRGLGVGMKAEGLSGGCGSVGPGAERAQAYLRAGLL